MFRRIFTALKSLASLPAMSAVSAVIVVGLQQPRGDAYLDAGTGSIIIQTLVGILAGGLLLLKIYWKRVKNFFKNLSSRRRGDGDIPAK